MKIVFTILFSLLTLCSFAQDKPKTNKDGDKKEQKKEEYKVASTIKTVRAFLKESKYADANNEIEKALKEHPEARSSALLYSLKSTALHNLVLAENRKMYLNQKPDTTKYFSFIYSLYESAITCDSLEQIPDEKGRVMLRNRDINQQRLLQFRKNLSTADRYFYQKKDYKNAYKYGNLYLDTKHSPIFNKVKGGNALADEKDSVSHSTLAVFLAYAYNNHKGVVKHLPIALQDSARHAQLYEVASKTYFELKDSLSAYVSLLDGVREYPTNDYFYMTLVRYFNEKRDYQSAINLMDSILVHIPGNRNCNFIKAKEYEYMGKYDEAIKVMKQVIEKHPDDYEAYSSLANMYLEKAHREYRNFNIRITDRNYQKERKNIDEYYREAKKSYERCKALAEQKVELWLEGLRECYYKLNLGTELKSLDRVKR